ncbi:MAG TPA: DUF2304 family protein [Candidatus Nanoarchaeia archaeon]|nr:DUF2304 family protein [Candidatus Nanoarchaeia archaeon]
MIIEIIVSVLILAVLIKLVADLKKGKITSSKFYLWALVWVALAVIVFFPGMIIFLAKGIGIERAQDLPIYVSIILLFYLLFKIGIKIERVEQEITTLVKRLALKGKK